MQISFFPSACCVFVAFRRFVFHAHVDTGWMQAGIQDVLPAPAVEGLGILAAAAVAVHANAAHPQSLHCTGTWCFGGGVVLMCLWWDGSAICHCVSVFVIIIVIILVVIIIVIILVVMIGIIIIAAQWLCPTLLNGCAQHADCTET